MTCDSVRRKLEPYIDSELTAGELAEFEAHLRGCASCAAEALGLLQGKRMTRAAGARYSPTPEFRLRMEQSIRVKPRLPWWTARFPKLVTAFVMALLLLVSVTLWVGHAEREQGFAELTDLHVATLASLNPIDVVSTDRHTVKPWFAGRIPFSFDLPELQNSEFTLVGGRVAYFEHSSGAQLLFNLRKHQLSVFIFKEQFGEIPFRGGLSTATELAFHIETWSEGGLRYCIVSDAPASDVHALSKLLRSATHP
jgi:anti-sigma factor RsiW